MGGAEGTTFPMEKRSLLRWCTASGQMVTQVIGALHGGLCEHLENLHPADSNEAQH